MNRIFILFAIFSIAANAHAISADKVKAIAIGEGETRIEALRGAVTEADEKTLAFIQALSDDAVKVVDGLPVIVKDGKAVDPVTGAESALSEAAEDVMNNNRMRGEIDSALAALKLMSKDEAVRREAVKTLQGEVDENKLPLLDKAFAQETVPDIKERLGLLRAAALSGSADSAKRLAAAQLLAESSQAATKTLLLERLSIETDPKVKSALQLSLSKVEARLAWGDRLGAIFSGISLGSILLLVCLLYTSPSPRDGLLSRMPSSA